MKLSQKEVRFHYVANSDEKLSLHFSQKQMAVANFTSNSKKSGITLSEYYKFDDHLLALLTKKYDFQNEKFFRCEYSDSFKTRPPPSFFLL